jgi:hypothetical protein
VPYCVRCGTQETAGQNFCPVCGAQSVRAPAPARPKGAVGDAKVLVGIDLVPPRQSRWSVLFRVVLLLPLIFVLAAILIAAFFVAVVAWFAALATKRVPEGMQRFLTRALRFHANVLAYQDLLIPRWPGITLNEKARDQVRIEVDRVELRRASVFFRLILALPGLIVAQAVSLGSYPLLLAMWIVGIVTGREPRALHQALALILRYTIRFEAYFFLLTPTQPFQGFLGDEDDIGTSAPLGSDVVPLPTRWSVVKAAKVFVVIALILSAPVYAFQRKADNVLLSPLKSALSRIVVEGSYRQISSAISSFDSSASMCQSSTSTHCMMLASQALYDALSQQTSLLSRDSFFPSDALGASIRYEAAINALGDEVLEVERSRSVQSQLNIVDGKFQSTVTDFNNDYAALKARIGG